ncbi:MAG: hypothetical protein WHS86_07530 [Desulfosoma sp.]
MSGPMPPKTLAKTLAAIACSMPGEYGLFWDDDGTMPWKEFYWALQEDPRLRFVRESTVKELSLLGFALPFVVEGSRIRLLERPPGTRYSEVADPPARLFAAIRRRQLTAARSEGLRALHRSYVPLWTDKSTAERMARRRGGDPLALEVLAREACASGSRFYKAGDFLFLTKAVDPAHLVFPKAALEEESEKGAGKPKRSPKGEDRVRPDAMPGSFAVDPRHMKGFFPDWAAEGEPKREPLAKKGKKEGSWKRAARKERRKREI